MSDPALGLPAWISLSWQNQAAIGSVELIFDTIKELNETTGTTILLVEQNAHMSLQVSHRGYVLQTGEIVTSGSAKDLQQDESIKKAYLGIE